MGIAYRRFLAGLVLVSLTGTSVAFNLRYLEFSQARQFTDKDWELSTQAARDALEHKQDGEAVTWQNPETGHHGSATPISTFQKGGQKCRELKIMNAAEGAPGEATHSLCRQPDGTWKVAPGH